MSTVVMVKHDVKNIQDLSKESVKKLLSQSGWSRYTLLFILVVLLWNSAQIWLMNGTVNRVDKYNQGVVDEMGGLVGDVKVFADDLNEIRRFLLLPEKNYSVDQGSREKTGIEDEKGSDNAVAMFAFLDSVVQESDIVKNRQAAQPLFEALFVDKVLSDRLTGARLQPGERAELQVKFIDGTDVLADGQKNLLFGQPLYSLIFSADENKFMVQSALGEEKLADYTKTDFSARLADFMIKNLDAVRTKKLQVQADAKLAEEKARLQVEQELLKKKQELEGLVKDKAFVETLQGLGLKVAEKSREENNKYIFDVTDQSGKVRFSVFLELSSGMIKVLKDEQELDIKSFLTDGSKKKT